MDNLDMERYYDVLEQHLKDICKMMEELKERKEIIENRRLEAIQQGIASLEWKEALRKYKSWTVKEKACLDLIDNLRLYCFSCGDNEQEWSTDSDPPYLNGRSLMSSTLGYRFQPTDEEIIVHLKNKNSNLCQTHPWSPIKDCADLYDTQPGNLPGANSIKENKALYFYVLTKKKSGNGDRTGPNGSWRATGNNKISSETGSEIGYRRTLKYFEFPDNKNQKFYKFAKPTNWMMHEYRLATTSSQSLEESLEHWTICKITWTGKNIKLPNDFNKDGSIGPLEMMVQKNSSSMDWLHQKYFDNDELKMHVQNEGDLKISKIVDSKPEEIAQSNHHSNGDEFGGWTEDKRGKLREQRMNREIHQSEEVTPCYASGIHPTPSMMITMHEIEIGGVEPQQFKNPGKITEEFGPSISEQTAASLDDWFLNPHLIGSEDENQSESDPSFLEQTAASWEDENQPWFDYLSIADLIGMEDENRE